MSRLSSVETQPAPAFGRVARTLQIGIGLIFIIAAVGKAWAIFHHAAVVRYLMGSLAPGWNASIVIASIMLVLEGVLGVHLILDALRRTMLIAVGITLAGFTLVLIRLLNDPQAPDCGCFGVFQIVIAAHEGSPVGIVRNVALLWVIGWLILENRYLVSLAAE